MKIIIILCIIMASEVQGSWFDHDERERRIEAEQQYMEQKQETGSWQIVAGILGIGAVILFTVGTALGSRTLRHHGKQ